MTDIIFISVFIACSLITLAFVRLCGGLMPAPAAKTEPTGGAQ